MKKLCVLLLVASMACSMTACSGLEVLTGSGTDNSVKVDDIWQPIDLNIPGYYPEGNGSSSSNNQKPGNTKPQESQNPDDSNPGGSGETPGSSGTPTTAQKYEDTKTGKFYSQFDGGNMYMRMTVKQDGKTMKITMALKGEKVYMKTDLGDDGVVIILWDSKNFYLADPKTKQAIKMLDNQAGQSVDGMVVDESKADVSTMVEGERTISGKTYQSETWKDNGQNITMCFDGDRAVYMINNEGTAEEQVVKIVEYGTSVKDSLFKIPSSYKIVEKK